MSSIQIPARLPVDDDGFLRRECPACCRQFKWLPQRENGASAPVDPATAVDVYFCPYCHESAPKDAWWTQEQLAYMKSLVLAEAVGPLVQQLQSGLVRANRPDSLIRFSVTPPSISTPEPLTEAQDMVIVVPPCHAGELFKVDEAWETDVACLICGTLYAMAQVCSAKNEKFG